MMTKTFNILLQSDSHKGTNTITPTQQSHTLTAHNLTTHVSYDIQHRPNSTKIL